MAEGFEAIAPLLAGLDVTLGNAPSMQENRFLWVGIMLVIVVVPAEHPALDGGLLTDVRFRPGSGRLYVNLIAPVKNIGSPPWSFHRWSSAASSS